MSRPKKKRYVTDEPGTLMLVPSGNDETCEPIELGRDEYEALRLVDYEGLFQESAGDFLGVSRQTAGRVLQSARTKLAAAFVEGRPVHIEGGEIEKMIQYICKDCGSQWMAFEGSPPARHCPYCGRGNLSVNSEVCGRGRGGRGHRRRKWAERGGRGGMRRHGRDAFASDNGEKG